MSNRIPVYTSEPEYNDELCYLEVQPPDWPDNPMTNGWVTPEDVALHGALLTAVRAFNDRMNAFRMDVDE